MAALQPLSRVCVCVCECMCARVCVRVCVSLNVATLLETDVPSQRGNKEAIIPSLVFLSTYGKATQMQPMKVEPGGPLWTDEM